MTGKGLEWDVSVCTVHLGFVYIREGLFEWIPTVSMFSNFMTVVQSDGVVVAFCLALSLGTIQSD